MKSLDEYYDGIIVNPCEKKMEKLNSFEQEITTLSNSIPDTINKFPEYLRAIQSEKAAISAVTFDLSSEVFASAAMLDLEKDEAELADRQATEMEQMGSKIQMVFDAIIAENRAYNQSLQDDVDKRNSVFNQLHEKRDELMTHSNEITDICAKFGITTSDVDIDESTLKPQKLNRLYDEYISYFAKTKANVNPISVLKERIPDVRMQFGLLAIIIVLCFTPILSVLSIAFTGYCIYLLKSSSRRVKYFSVLQSILYKVNIDKLPHDTIDETLLQPTSFDDEESLRAAIEEYDEIAAVDAEETALEEKLENETEEFRQYQEDTMAEISKYSQQASKDINDKQVEFNKTKTSLLSQLEVVEKTANTAYQKMKDEYVGFGDKFTEDGWFNTKLVLGFKDWIEETVDVGEKNIIIRPGVDKKLLDSFIRCLFVNALANVNYMKMCVHVIDPNNMGQTIIPFYRADLASHIKIIQKDVGEVLSDFTTLAQQNLELTKGLSVQEYNKECQKLGRDTIPYNLILVLSQPKKLEDTENLLALFQYSFKAGVIIWAVSDDIPGSENIHVFNRPFEGVANRFMEQDNRDWCAKVSENYHKKIEGYKPPSLDWDTFIKVACPPEKQWTFNADDNIYMYPGFQNGDPEYCLSYPLGNGGNVHALAVGTTGAGKSIFLHHIVQTLCEMYSPQELELWLCDFKGTEFQFYMASETFEWTLPQIKACLCTSDGAYATSLFHAVRNITDARFQQMKMPNDYKDSLAFDDGEPIPNFDNAKNWNIYWRERAKEKDDDRYLANCFKRIILLCDEFQVIFAADNADNLDTIKQDMTQISKLGRAANVHLFFTSQSMRGTLSSDILNQFSLRFALRCTEDTAQDIMGTNYAALLPKFGQLYVSASGIEKEKQPRFYTPFISTSVIHRSTKDLAIRAETDKMPKNDVITYDEGTKHFIGELDEFYDRLYEEDKVPEDGTLFVIGSRMAYSENKAPDNFVITRKNNENIFACVTDYTDFVFMFKTMMKNITRSKEKSTVIINSQIEDLDYLVDAKSYITNQELHGELLKQTVVEFASWLESLIKSRKESGKTSPIWIFLLGWDKGTGFGVDTNIQVRSKINTILQQCGVYGIHIIFYVTGTSGINISTISACNYMMACKCTMDDSMQILGKKLAAIPYEIKTGWVFCKRDGVITRDKLYISEVERTVAKNELVL